EQAGRGDVVEGGDHHDGHNFFLKDGFAQAGEEMLGGQRALGEKLFHETVVAFGDHFNEFLVGRFGGVGEIAGNVFDGGLAVAVGLVNVGLHGDEVHHAAEIPFFANGQLQRNDRAAEFFDERFEGAIKTGQFAVHPSEDKGAGNVVLRGEVPDFF